MIYLVTNQKELFESGVYFIIDIDKCLSLLWNMPMIQVDTETNGRDAHINKVLCIQFGNDILDCQIVVDTTTISLNTFKEVLESKYLILQNAKFDLQFLYNFNIHPTKVYDIMIVEQFLYLGYPSGLTISEEEYKQEGYNFPYHKNINNETGKVTYTLSFALDAIANKRLNIYIDKEIRSQIIWRGLDKDVIKYAANDVKYLEKIMRSQLNDLRKIPNAIKGAKIECDFIPVIAYLEWCGIKLDESRWKEKMRKDKIKLSQSEEALNKFLLEAYNKGNKKLEEFIYVNNQPSLFEEFNTDLGVPQVRINWSSSPQVIKVAKILGFNTLVIDKKTGKEKDSAMEKQLKSQKGINDEFLRLYFGEGEEENENYFPGYSGSYKVVTSFGQGHLNAINPNTGRIHTVYRAIGTISGRMSSGSDQVNTDLAKLKGLPINPSAKQKKEGKGCTYPNMQQLPHDKETRACFVAEKGNLFCSCDYSAMEARIGADVYNEHKLLDEFLYGSGDTHAAYAKAVFAKELEGIDTKDVKKKRPDLRNKVKSVEFAVQFGSDGTAVAPQLKIPVEEARQLVINLLNGMTGLKAFKEKSSKFVLNNGYVDILPQTGHRGYWYDWKHWKEIQASYTSEFWEDYKKYHKGTNDEVCKEVKIHFQAKSKWCDRMSLNLPTQGGGAVVLKEAMITLYKWVIDNGYWGKILFCNFTHDECNTEFPEELKDTYPQIVANIMQEAAAKYYHKLPIPAIPEVDSCWRH